MVVNPFAVLCHFQPGLARLDCVWDGADTLEMVFLLEKRRMKEKFSLAWLIIRIILSDG
jgi:hypothetical protein